MSPYKHGMTIAVCVVAFLLLFVWSLGGLALYESQNQHSLLFVPVFSIGVLLCLGIVVYAACNRNNPNWKLEPTQRLPSPIFQLWVMMGAGSLILGANLFYYFQVYKAFKNDLRLPGIITRKFSGGGKNASMEVEVQFILPIKKEIKTIASDDTPWFLGFALPKAGDQVEVLYNPGKPKDVFINEFWVLNTAPIFFGLLAAIFFLGARNQYRLLRSKET